MRRGDIYLLAFPHADGTTTKDRPVLVVQADFYNQRIGNVLVASITTNLKHRNEPAHVVIDTSTPEGRVSGLRADSLISCLNLAVVRQDRLRKRIGELSVGLMGQVDEALRAALDL